MALDLTLMAIPEIVAKRVFQKAADRMEYAMEFDKITDPEEIQLHLRMVRENPDGISEEILNELYQDSIRLMEHYPDKDPAKYHFYSRGRGYDTLDYLLLEYFRNKPAAKFQLTDPSNIFYSGTEINTEMAEYNHFHYWDNYRTSDFNDFIKNIEFSDLVEFYDAEQMSDQVYKLVSEDQFGYLKEEFEELKTFYRLASSLHSFVLIKVS